MQFLNWREICCMQLKPCCSSFLAEKRKRVVFDYGQQENEWQVLAEKTAACSMNDAVDVANDLAAFNGKMFQESIPVDRISKKAKVSIEHNKKISFPLMLENLQCLALDLFYLSRECLDSFVGNFLRIRTWTCQNSRKYWKNRRRSYENVEAPFSSDEKFGTRLIDHTDQQSPQGIFNALAPSMKSNPCLESKAQLLPALGSSVVHNAIIFSIIRDVIIFQRSQLTTDAEESDDQISACSVYLRDPSFGLNSNTSLSCKKDLACKLKRSSSEANGSCCLLGIMTQLISQNTALFMSRSLRYELRNCFFKMFQSRFLHKSCRSYAFGITQILDATNVTDIDSDKEVWVTSTKTEECQEDISIAPDRWSCVSYNQHCAEETASGLAATGLIGHRDIMLLPPSSVTPPLARRVHDDVHVFQLYQGFKISHYSEVQNMKRMPAGIPDGTTSEIVHELCQTSSTECDKNKKFCHDIHPDALDMSQATHQLEARKSWLFPTSLHMKFPKGCSLPTRKELIKKFIRFGPINSPLTKVYPTPSSARVVFLHKVDAVAAYHYAKRKKVFLGLGNVKFWLDSNKNVRSGSNTNLITGQKSCLKRSGHLGRESKGPPKVVRFSWKPKCPGFSYGDCKS